MFLLYDCEGCSKLVLEFYIQYIPQLGQSNGRSAVVIATSETVCLPYHKSSVMRYTTEPSYLQL